MKNVLTKLTMILAAGWLCAAPSVVMASNDDTEVTGALAAFNSASVRVGALTCAVNAGTEFEDSNSNHISRSRFSVGDRVRLRCRDGVARNLKLLNGSGSSSSSSSNSSDSSSSDSSSSSSSSRSSSSSSSSGSGSADRNLRDSLTALDGVTTSAVATVRYQSSDNGREKKLIASVKVPAPSTTPPAQDLSEAAALNLTLTLFRRGTAYAQCTLEYDRDTQVSGVPAAEFKLDVRKVARLRNRKGYCDVNLTRDGVQNGLPNSRKRDTVTIEEETAGVFLEGTL